MGQTRNSNLLGKITILFVICFCILSAQAKYGGGTGEPNDPYLIYTPKQMNAIGADSNDWDKHFKLMADVDLGGYTGTSYNIIGNTTTRFTGVFDGNDHVISNFTYDSNGRNYIGLFGYVDDPNAEIRNLGLIDPNIDAGTSWNVGSLVGFFRDGTITGCYIDGGSVSGNEYVGGLVGGNRGTITGCYSTGSVSGRYHLGGLTGSNALGTISNCYSTVSVSGRDNLGGLVGINGGTITVCYATGSVSGTHYQVGGLVGFNYEGTINDCYATGDASVTGSCVGGLVGDNHHGTISNCYAKGAASGYIKVGGLVGSNAIGKISNSYSIGSVAGDEHVGGLVGYNTSRIEVWHSFWDVITSGQATSASGTGKTTAEMKMASTFLHWGSCAEVWTIDEGVDYPRLWWEDMHGEPIPAYSYGGGSGEPNDPYLIYTTEQLNTIGLIECYWDRHFILMADIDLGEYTGTSFNIIGYFLYRYSPDNKPFTGVFDGNGHTISNFTCTSTGTGGIGLFAYIDDPDAEIKNLGLIDPNVDAGIGDYVGSLVGYFKDGTITDCYVDGGSVSGTNQVGGLVGGNSGTINNCYSTGSVVGDDDVGGLVGGSRDTISNCYSTVSVDGYEGVGGLVGRNNGSAPPGIDNGTISNCYSTGSVEGYYDVGGLVGGNSGRITNCYSTGSVSGDQYVGGLVGEIFFVGNVTSSFWDIEISGQTTSDGGTGKTTAQMQMLVTFMDAGWDFSTPIWKMNCEGMSYPKLSFWQPVQGDFICPDGVDFFDFSFFAGHWAEDNCGASNDCDGTDLDLLGTVDIKDLIIFVDDWLRGF